MIRRLTTRYNDNDKQYDDANDKAHPHLHVLPPHLLSDPVGTASEALCGDCKVVGLILEAVEALATFGDLVDVAAHYVDSGVNFLERM